MKAKWLQVPFSRINNDHLDHTRARSLFLSHHAVRILLHGRVLGAGLRCDVKSPLSESTLTWLEFNPVLHFDQYLLERTTNGEKWTFSLNVAFHSLSLMRLYYLTTLLLPAECSNVLLFFPASVEFVPRVQEVIYLTLEDVYLCKIPGCTWRLTDTKVESRTHACTHSHACTHFLASCCDNWNHQLVLDPVQSCNTITPLSAVWFDHLISRCEKTAQSQSGGPACWIKGCDYHRNAGAERAQYMKHQLWHSNKFWLKKMLI